MTHQNPAWIVPALTIFAILVFSVAIILPMTRMKAVRIFGKYTYAVLWFGLALAAVVAWRLDSVPH
ncbi:MAG: hypothetical protein WA431_03800 [Candidatus Cybelea sp.]